MGFNQPLEDNPEASRSFSWETLLMSRQDIPNENDVHLQVFQGEEWISDLIS